MSLVDFKDKLNNVNKLLEEKKEQNNFKFEEVVDIIFSKFMPDYEFKDAKRVSTMYNTIVHFFIQILVMQNKRIK